VHLGVAVTQLEAYNRGQLRSDRTIRFYNQRLAVLRQELGDQRPIDGVTREEVRLFMAKISGRYSPETVRGTVVAVKRLFAWAAGEGMIQTDPLVGLRLPSLPRIDRPALSLEEVRSLFTRGFPKTKTGRRTRTMFLLAIDTGLRVSELCNLRLEDVHDDGSITVRQGKGRKDRVVFAGRQSIESIADYRRQDPSAHVGGPEANLWSLDNARHVTPASFRRALCRAGDRVGVEVHPHKLRRTFATMMLLNKADLFSLQELMGHSDISTTRKYIPRDLERLRSVHRSASPGDML